jgi:hypothetical protein
MQVNKILILFLSIITLSCVESTKKEGIVVNGQFRNASGVRLVFSEVGVDSIHNIDSITLDEIGLFRFRFNSSEAGIYILKSSTGDHILLPLEKDEEVNVSANLEKQPFNYKISGSPGALILKDFYDRSLVNQLKADSLRAVLMNNKESPDFYNLSLAFDTLFSELIEDQKNIAKTFIRKNPSSLTSLIVLNAKFGMKPLLNMEEDFQFFIELDSTLSKRYPANKHVLFHHQRVIEHQRQEREKQSYRR